MAQIDEDALREIRHKGESLLLEDLLLLIERHHPHEQPGISRETIESYAETLSESRDDQFNIETFHEKLNTQLTDSHTWAGKEAIYELASGRISRYPEAWHDRLGETADIREYIAFLQDEAPEFKDDLGRGGAGPGIPEQPLLDVVAVVGHVDRDDVKAQLQELREQGEIAEDADQHPNAGVVLRDRNDEFRDSGLDS
ncbi:hypothetical protein [Haladaptatus paucihalophilus]|uniref:hypothetical protein n=1 Tax=Haladaptatus paucihalophilus TaxID=367189 RepID=UPI00035F3B0E|nr:hypothetical protein [Haladaptatus paucihalophilus]